MGRPRVGNFFLRWYWILMLLGNLCLAGLEAATNKNHFYEHVMFKLNYAESRTVYAYCIFCGHIVLLYYFIVFYARPMIGYNRVENGFKDFLNTVASLLVCINGRGKTCVVIKTYISRWSVAVAERLQITVHQARGYDNCVGNYGVLIMAAVADIRNFFLVSFAAKHETHNRMENTSGYTQNTKSGLAD